MSTQFFGRNQAGEVSQNPVAVRFWGGRDRGTTWQFQTRQANEGFTAFESETGEQFTPQQFAEAARECETMEWEDNREVPDVY